MLGFVKFLFIDRRGLFLPYNLFFSHHHYYPSLSNQNETLGNPLLEIAIFVADASITKYYSIIRLGVEMLYGQK